MPSEHDKPATTRRLLAVKRELGYSPLSAGPDSDAESLSKTEPSQERDGHPPECVSCGYIQQGQPVDRCPECGLLFASCLRDPTPWSADATSPMNRMRTACGIWSWDRRLRIRTAMIPVTRESRLFAKYSIAVSTVPFGLSLGILNFNDSGPALTSIFMALIESVLGAALAGLLMLAAISSLHVAIQGTWRHYLQFVPASIDYATAWWPLLAVLGLVLSSLYIIAGPTSVFPLILFFSLASGAWGFWLWGSASESQHVRYVGARMLVVVLCLTVGGTWSALLIPGSARTFVRRLSSSMVRAGAAGGSTTYAFVLDVSRSPDEKVISTRLDGLRVPQKNRFVLTGERCTLEQVTKALSQIRDQVRTNDRFIVYVNSRTKDEAPGYIKLGDETLDSEDLARELGNMPTDHNLILIDSISGDKYLPSLKRNCSAVVIAAADNGSLPHTSGLKDFWDAATEVESDVDHNQRITVSEAFHAAFDSLSDQLRDTQDRFWRVLPGRTIDERKPKLEVFGKAKPEEFWLATPTDKADEKTDISRRTAAAPGSQPSMMLPAPDGTRGMRSPPPARPRVPLTPSKDRPVIPR